MRPFHLSRSTWMPKLWVGMLAVLLSAIPVAVVEAWLMAPPNPEFRTFMFKVYLAGNAGISLIFGIPVYLALRWLRYTQLLHLAVAGLLVGWCVVALPSLPSVFSVGQAAVMVEGNHVIISNGGFVPWGQFWHFIAISRPSLLGALAGVFVWAVGELAGRLSGSHHGA